MKYELNTYHRNISNEELINDMLRVKNELKKESIAYREYDSSGKYRAATIAKRFGSWNNALKKAGFPVNNRIDISDKELFKNFQNVWIQLGRQPKRREMKRPFSDFSEGPYINRFGSWRKALEEFVKYINTETKDEVTSKSGEVEYNDSKTFGVKHKTKREISDRLRFRILMRDGFTCRKCGRSPVKELGIELHVDHILPWSKGGETVPENLETKCKKCNLGKGNAFEV